MSYADISLLFSSGASCLSIRSQEAKRSTSVSHHNVQTIPTSTATIAASVAASEASPEPHSADACPEKENLLLYVVHELVHHGV